MDWNGEGGLGAVSEGALYFDIYAGAPQVASYVTADEAGLPT